jgi:hypothetical protein
VVKLFLGNRAVVLLLIPFLVIGYMLINDYSGYYVQETSVNLGLWGEVNSTPFTAKLLAGSLVMINAFWINYIYNSNQFFDRNSYISSLLYVVLMSFYHSFYSIDGLLLAHFFLVAMLHQLFKLNQNEDGRRRVFNAAFFAGLAATFHPPMVVLIPFVFIMIWTMRPFVVREFFLTLIGFAIPLFYVVVFMWYAEHTVIWKIVGQTTNYTSKQMDFLVTSVLFTLLFLLSLLTLKSKVSKSSNRLKNLVSVLWWLLFVGIFFGVFDVLLYKQIERFSFLMLPLSFFLTYSFSNITFGKSAAILFYLTFTYSAIKFFI